MCIILLTGSIISISIKSHRIAASTKASVSEATCNMSCLLAFFSYLCFLRLMIALSSLFLESRSCDHTRLQRNGSRSISSTSIKIEQEISEIASQFEHRINMAYSYIPQSLIAYFAGNQLIVTTTTSVHSWGSQGSRTIFQSYSGGILASRWLNDYKNLLAVSYKSGILLKSLDQTVSDNYRLSGTKVKLH